MADGAYEVAIDTSINSDGITAFVAQVVAALEEIQSRASKAQDEGTSQAGLSGASQRVRKQAEKTIRSSGASEADQARGVDQVSKAYRNHVETVTKSSRSFQDLGVISKAEQKRIRDQARPQISAERQSRTDGRAPSGRFVSGNVYAARASEASRPVVPNERAVPTLVARLPNGRFSSIPQDGQAANERDNLRQASPKPEQAGAYDDEVAAASALKAQVRDLAQAKAASDEYIANTAGAAAAMAALKRAETEAIAATNAYADEGQTRATKSSTAQKSKQVELASTSDDDLALQGQNQATAARQRVVTTLAQIEASKDDVAGELEVIAGNKAHAAQLAILRASDQGLIDSQVQLTLANKQERDAIAAGVKNAAGPQKPATAFQRIQAHFDPNPDADASSKRTFGQFAGSHAVNTLGYAIPGLAFGVGIEELSKSVAEAGKAQVAFAELGAQFAALGQTGQLKGYTQSIKDIAGDTGLATSEVAELGAAMKGVYGNTSQAEIALKGVTSAAVAMGLTVKEAQEDLTAITQSFSELQNQGGKAITEVSNEMLHLQDLTGVDSKQILTGTAEAGPTTNQVGITPNQTASIIAAGVQVSGLSGDTIGQTLAKAVDGITQNYGKIYGIYQNTPSLRKELPTLDKDTSAQAILQIIGDLKKLPAAEQIEIEKSLGINASALPALAALTNSAGKAGQLSTTTAPADRTAEEQKKKLDTLTGSFDRLRSEVTNLGVSILDSAFGSVLVDFAKAAGAVVNQLDQLNTESGGLFGNFVELAAAAVALRVIITGIKLVGSIPGIIKRTATGVGPGDVAAKALTGSAGALTESAGGLSESAVALVEAAGTIGTKNAAGDAESLLGKKGASAAERDGAGALETDAAVAAGRKGILGKLLGAGGGAESSAGGGVFGLGEGTAVLGADSALGAEAVGIGGLATSLATLPAIIAAITGAVAGAEIYKHLLGGQNGGFQHVVDSIFAPSSTPAGYNPKGLGIAQGTNPYVTEGLDGAGDPGKVLTGKVFSPKDLTANANIRATIERELAAAKGSLTPQQNYSVAVDTKEANAGSESAFLNLEQLLGTLGGGKPGTPANPGVKAAIIADNKVTSANATAKSNAQLDNPSYLKSTAGDRIKQIAANKNAEAATVAQAAALQGVELQDLTSVQSGYAAGDKSYAQLVSATNDAVTAAQQAFVKTPSTANAEAVEAALAAKTQILDQAVQLQVSETQALQRPGSVKGAQASTRAQAGAVANLKDPSDKAAAGSAIVSDLNTELQDSVNNATSLSDALRIQAAGVKATPAELAAYNAAQPTKATRLSSLTVLGEAPTAATTVASLNQTTQAQQAANTAKAAEDPVKVAQAAETAANQTVKNDKAAGYSATDPQTVTDAAAAKEAKQSVIDAQNAATESTIQLKETLAQAGNDPLAAAKAARDLATQELADAHGLAEQNKAAGDMATANAQYNQAIISLIGARAGLVSALAGAGGDSVAAALATYNGAIATANAQAKADKAAGTDPNTDPTYIQDKASQASSQGDYTQSIVDLLTARSQLASTLAGAGGDPIGAALIAYQGAIATANAQAQRDEAAGQNPNNDTKYLSDLGTVATDEATLNTDRLNLITAQAATASALSSSQGKPVQAAQQAYAAAVKVADAQAKYDLAHGKNPVNDTQYQSDLANVYTTAAGVVEAQISNIESVGQTELYLGKITATQYIGQLQAELVKVKGNKQQTLRIEQDIRQVQDSAGGNLDFDLPSNLLVSPTLFQARRTESNTVNNNPGAVTVNINVNGGDTSSAVRKLLKAVNAPTSPANNALAPHGRGW